MEMSNQPMKGITCCGDCAYYNWKKHKCPRATVEGKPTDHFYADCPLPDVTPILEWISVKDRLPEEGKWVLAWESQGFVVVDAWEGEKWRIAERNCGSIDYWMPLPKPPKEET